MPDNVTASPGSGGAVFATRTTTYSGDAATHVPVTGIAAFTGSDDAKTVADIGGDATNGLDVDVTRLPALVAGTANIGDVDVLTVPADPFGVNADAASATGSISAKLRFIAATGIPVTGTVTVAAHAVTNAGTFAVQTTGGAGTGLSASVSVTRPSNTTAYTAGDVVGVTGGGTATMTFALGATSASRILITSTTFERDEAALISGESNYTLHLYNVTQPGAQVDNAAFNLASGDRTAYLGSISLGTPVDLGGMHFYVGQDAINKQIKLAGTSVFGVLVTDGAYTPASAAVHVVTLHAVQL